jgi:F0F1-type ATP synthase membrane subunit a
MKYVLASLFGALLLFGFIVLAGAGHGWLSGAFSCLPLAPISFAAWLNALRARPSLHVAIGLLVAAGVVLACTAYATRSEGTNYFFHYWRVQGPFVGPVLALVYFNWLFACGLTWWRRRA